MDTRLDFPGIQIFTRSHEEISGVWAAADRFWTNEREYPLRLNTSQSHFIWWLAARQEMLSSSKYFLNTTKYLYKSPSPGFWGRKTEVQRGRHSTETQWTLAQCSWCRVSVPGAPVSHAAGPGLAPALATWGASGDVSTRCSHEEPSSHQLSSGHWAVQSGVTRL